MSPWLSWLPALLPHTMEHQWQPIGRTSNQVILYHRPSNVLSVREYTQDSISISTLPETPGTESRTPSTSNLPVLARIRRPQDAAGNAMLGRRSSAVVRRQSPIESSVIPPSGLCPYCYRPMSKNDHESAFADDFSDVETPSAHGSAHVFPIQSDETGDGSVVYPRQQWDTTAQEEAGSSGLLRVGPYFQILEQSVDGSRASTPVQNHDASRESRTPGGGQEQTRSIEGYYHRFFIEEKRLGMGAEGSVYLCQVSSSSVRSQVHVSKGASRSMFLMATTSATMPSKK